MCNNYRGLHCFLFLFFHSLCLASLVSEKLSLATLVKTVIAGAIEQDFSYWQAVFYLSLLCTFPARPRQREREITRRVISFQRTTYQLNTCNIQGVDTRHMKYGNVMAPQFTRISLGPFTQRYFALTFTARGETGRESLPIARAHLGRTHLVAGEHGPLPAFHCAIETFGNALACSDRVERAP